MKALEYSLIDKLLAYDNLERKNHKNGDDDGQTEYDHYGAPQTGTQLFAAGFGGFGFQRVLEFEAFIFSFCVNGYFF